ncbi:MAG: alpha/beta hydrolase [Sulfurovum sp.]|nr:alpha/beta hydrolase [Sulfurovum sp.]
MAIKEIYYKEASFKLSYEIVNPQAQKVILILHGWGSNKEIMKQSFGTRLPQYKHLYVDMPGFGKSSNTQILSTQDYANILQSFVTTLGIEVSIAMGHSFGGKVSTLLNPPCLVLLSSSGVLVPKVILVHFKIALFKLLKPLGLHKIQQLFVSPDAKGMSHEMYETFKNVVNEEFEQHFIDNTSKALCFWGKADTATPLWSGEKIASLLENAPLYPLEGDHFFFVKHPDFIAETLITHCKELDLC